MKRFWKRRGETELDFRLQERRRAARPDFVTRLAEDVRPRGRRAFAPTRIALAAALTVVMLGAVAAVGGATAGAAVRDQLFAVVKSVNKKVTPQSKAARLATDDDDDNDDSGDDQYKEERRQCRKAATQAFKDQQEVAHDEYSACKRAERQRHKAAMEACDGNEACEDAERAEHQRNLRECREAWQERMRELAEAHRAAQKRCNQIGR